MLGKLPERWWQRSGFAILSKTAEPWSLSLGFRSLYQRLWQMGRGETPRTCELQEMEMDCLRRLLEGMLAYESSERVSVREVME